MVRSQFAVDTTSGPVTITMTVGRPSTGVPGVTPPTSNHPTMASPPATTQVTSAPPHQLAFTGAPVIGELGVVIWLVVVGAAFVSYARRLPVMRR